MIEKTSLTPLRALSELNIMYTTLVITGSQGDMSFVTSLARAATVITYCRGGVRGITILTVTPRILVPVFTTLGSFVEVLTPGTARGPRVTIALTGEYPGTPTCCILATSYLLFMPVSGSLSHVTRLATHPGDIRVSVAHRRPLAADIAITPPYAIAKFTSWYTRVGPATSPTAHS